MAQMSDLERALLGAIGGGLRGYGNYLDQQRQDKQLADQRKQRLAEISLSNMLARQRADEAFRQRKELIQGERAYQEEPVTIGSPGNAIMPQIGMTVPRGTRDQAVAPLMYMLRDAAASKLGTTSVPSPYGEGNIDIPGSALPGLINALRREQPDPMQQLDFIYSATSTLDDFLGKDTVEALGESGQYQSVQRDFLSMLENGVSPNDALRVISSGIGKEKRRGLFGWDWLSKDREGGAYKSPLDQLRPAAQESTNTKLTPEEIRDLLGGKNKK